MSDRALFLLAAGLGLYAMTRRPKKAPRPAHRIPIGGWTAAPATSTPAAPRTPSRTTPAAPSRTNP